MVEDIEIQDGYEHEAAALTKNFDNSDEYRRVDLTGALEALYAEESDDWMAEFDRYAAGESTHELDTMEAAVVLAQTTGYATHPEELPLYDAEFSVADSNLEAGNNGDYFVDEEDGRVAAEVGLARAFSTDNGAEHERGSIVLEPLEDKGTESLKLPEF